MQVRVREHVFNSVQACADFFGIKPGTVYCALSRGKADTIGVGKGNLPGNKLGKGRAKAVKIGNTIFASRLKADKALGLTPGHTGKILRSGSPERMQLLMRKVMEYEAKIERDKRRQLDREISRGSGQSYDA